MKRAGTKPLVEAQMISLADIAFLIIFFFLLTSTFMKDTMTLRLPEAQKTAQAKSAITVLMDKDAKIYLNGDPVSDRNTLEGLLKGALGGRKDPNQLQVRFKADKSLKYKDYSPIYEAISNAGGVIAVMHDVKK